MARELREYKIVAGTRILVIDDEPPICEYLQNALRRIGATVKCVNNGEDGKKAIIDDAEYNLVITDNRMPTMSGLDLIEWMAHAATQTPVILHTAEDIEGIDGVFTVIKKPGDLAEIVEHIQARIPGCFETVPQALQTTT